MKKRQMTFTLKYDPKRDDGTDWAYSYVIRIGRSKWDRATKRMQHAPILVARDLDEALAKRRHSKNYDTLRPRPRPDLRPSVRSFDLRVVAR